MYTKIHNILNIYILHIYYKSFLITPKSKKIHFTNFAKKIPCYLF